MLDGSGFIKILKSSFKQLKQTERPQDQVYDVNQFECLSEYQDQVFKTDRAFKLREGASEFGELCKTWKDHKTLQRSWSNVVATGTASGNAKSEIPERAEDPNQATKPETPAQPKRTVQGEFIKGLRFWDRAMATYLQWHKSLRKPKKHVSERWNESESDIDDPPSTEEIQDLLRQIEAEMQEQKAEIKVAEPEFINNPEVATAPPESRREPREESGNTRLDCATPKWYENLLKLSGANPAASSKVKAPDKQLLCQIVGVTPLKIEVDKLSVTELSAKMAKRIREDSCSTEFEVLDVYMSDDEPEAKPLTHQKSAQGLQVVGTWAMQLITDLKSQKGWMRVGNYVEGKSQKIE